MLSRPDCGWTDFALEGTSTYGLSYLNDIAFEWIDEAIHGLSNLTPFCVKGYMEPDRMLCVVSYYNCHIIVEDEDRIVQKLDNVKNEYSTLSMLDFCKKLYEDINSDIEGWASFVSYIEYDKDEKENMLRQKLEVLYNLILEKEVFFDDKHCFM